MGTNRRAWVYHHKKAPEGKIASAEEAESLYRKGWVDTPAKFAKSGVSNFCWFWAKIIARTLAAFYLAHWKWLWGIATAVLIACLK